VVAHSEGGRVEVDGDSVTMIKSLRKRTVVARSEAGVEVVACSGAGDNTATRSRDGIEDDRWQQRCDGF
jgi:hypothetical protein